MVQNERMQSHLRDLPVVRRIERAVLAPIALGAMLAASACEDHTAKTRTARARYARAPGRRKDRNLTLSRNVQLSRLVEQVRTQTEAYRRTDVKDQMRALRDKLDPDDQMLLILRVDRRMEWRDLATVMCVGEDAAGVGLNDEELARESARLRKRFERVKEELRRLARESGLLR